jgi:hypothetical protein
MEPLCPFLVQLQLSPANTELTLRRVLELTSADSHHDIFGIVCSLLAVSRSQDLPTRPTQTAICHQALVLSIKWWTQLSWIIHA